MDRSSIKSIGGGRGPGQYPFLGPQKRAPKRDIFYIFSIFGIFGIFGKIGFLAYLIDPGVPGPLKSYSASENTPGDLSTASKKKKIEIFLMLDLCFVINAILTLYFDAGT